jgi:hypothetical protein
MRTAVANPESTVLCTRPKRMAGPSDRNWKFGIEHLSDPTNVQFSMLNSYPRQRL